MRALGFQVKKADVRKMIADIDAEDTITFDGFVEIMTGRMGDRDSKEEIAKVFALFDHEGNGKISFRDLKRVVTELGENIPDEEMREMIEEADKDQDGFVVFDDFYKILKKTDDGAVRRDAPPRRLRAHPGAPRRALLTPPLQPPSISPPVTQIADDDDDDF
jgi:Ca2+-binding EF-hand superfamily protein